MKGGLYSQVVKIKYSQKPVEEAEVSKTPANNKTKKRIMFYLNTTLNYQFGFQYARSKHWFKMILNGYILHFLLENLISTIICFKTKFQDKKINIITLSLCQSVLQKSWKRGLS